jgi:hypothetical protein
MQKLNFSININASKEKVWNTLFNDKTYREWTSVFAPGSYAETDWNQGSKALFLDGTGNGMVSRIAESKPHEFLSIEHMGFVKEGKEDTESKEVKNWSGAKENYTLSEKNGVTELVIDMDSAEQYKDYFTKTWPEALGKLKEISER